ncbi:3'-5' exonuclease [Lysinibacter sp. HNR]|uniref:3'-5' exonuclease n=1 Tax=Lysinibacter sp. HNR TaxID=3031408 RepID=UPI0024358A5C|nr:3'-5' exonuclease [Lysinibacter sp. HNR]WGD38341.1 3'-5' exonuclease [Lysinibacter sp. HNR]
MPVDFTAIDFETANSHGASACSVGLVKVRNSIIVDRASWLIRPPEKYGTFLDWNTRIHGMTPRDVEGAEGWEEQFSRLIEFTENDVLIAHNASFDMGVIRASCEATAITVPRLNYLCSVQLARKTYSLASYRLPAVAQAAGVTDFQHHEALADAEACASIVVDAHRRHGADNVIALSATTGVAIKTLLKSGGQSTATQTGSAAAPAVKSVRSPRLPGITSV